jgi:hypothetical protein
MIGVAAALSGLAVVAIVVFASGNPNAAARPGPSVSANAQLAALAQAYLSVANPSDDQLETEENSYATAERGNLAAAKADLRKQVATERLFDKQLGAIQFTPAAETVAQALIRVNKSRFAVTLRQARSTTLAQLRSLDNARKAGDAAVEVQAKAIRVALHLPPPSTN